MCTTMPITEEIESAILKIALVHKSSAKIFARALKMLCTKILFYKAPKCVA